MDTKESFPLTPLNEDDLADLLFDTSLYEILDELEEMMGKYVIIKLHGPQVTHSEAYSYHIFYNFGEYLDELYKLIDAPYHYVSLADDTTPDLKDVDCVTVLGDRHLKELLEKE